MGLCNEREAFFHRAFSLPELFQDWDLTKIFMSPKGAITRLHYDTGGAHAWLSQVQGTGVGSTGVCCHETWMAVTLRGQACGSQACQSL